MSRRRSTRGSGHAFLLLVAASGCAETPSTSSSRSGASPQGSDLPMNPPPPPPSVASPPPAPTVAVFPKDAPEAKAMLDTMQGRWKIESSRSLGGGSGSVFYPLRGKVLSFRENILTLPSEHGSAGWETRKTIGVVKGAVAANGTVIEVEHRGDFRSTVPFDADPAQVGGYSKGWDRHALVRVE